MTKNYFEIFDLPMQFDIDLEQLDEKYFELQRLSHPDMKNGVEIDSAMLNNGYKALKQRFKRAEYLIELKEESEFSAPPELLMEMMELREGDLAENVKKAKAELESLFIEFAENIDAGTFVRMKYLKRFIEENS